METFNQEVYELLSLNLSDHQLQSFRILGLELMEWNERINLTSITDSTGIYTKHFLDSLSCIKAMREKPPKNLIDVGTGAGFPGIPLKIAIPGLKVTLVESIGKKTDFCKHIIEKLNLKDIDVIQTRAEELARLPEYREKFDCAAARAVAGMPALVEYLLPFARVGGMMLAQKGESGPLEVQQAEKAIHLLGGRLRHIKKINLPRIVEDRYLISIDKVSTTPEKYPRRTGVPLKTPIV